MNKNNSDADFIKSEINDNITLPESLSPENITKLVSGEKQKKRKAGVIRRFVAASVAACIIITGTAVISRHSFSNPENTVAENDESLQKPSQENAASYDELLDFIKDYAKEYNKRNNRGKYWYSFSTMLEDAVEGAVDKDNAEAAPGSPSYNGSASMGGVVDESVADSVNKGNYGEVNLREENVYEDDIIITDGEYLYCVDSYGKRLVIVKAEEDGTMTTVYEEEKSKDADENGNGDTVYFSGLYKYENYLIAAYTKYSVKNYYYTGERSGVMIYDVTDKSAPVLTKEIALDGNYVSSRIVDGKLILISRYSITEYFEAEDETNLIPSVYNGELKENITCDCIIYSEKDSPECYVNIGKLDLNDISKDIAVTSYLGTIADTYCTKDTLYTIGYEYTYSRGGILTDDVAVTFGGVMMTTSSACAKITKVDITGEKAEILCRTEFNGTVLNSYSIDEYNGYLRVAVNNDGENCIYVFDENLGKVGEITGIAEGEQIKSARFMGDTAYVVTFVQTDPLFVIDLSNPEKPEILGEVKLPGFSSYLHPVGDGLLVGIGVGGTETGVDGSSKISLFDVTDPASPKEIDYLRFPTSQLGTESKAFMSVTENSFFVVYQNWSISSELLDTAEYYGYYIHSGALFVEVTDGKLHLKNAYLGKSTEAVSRATFIDDTVYIFSEGRCGIASFNMTTGEFIDTVNAQSDEYIIKPVTTPVGEILY